MLLAGCAGPDEGGPQVVDGPRGLKILVAARTAGGMEALASGVLERGPGGCLYLLAGPDQREVLVWPFGTVASDGEADGVKVPGLGVLEVGQSVALTGGSEPLPSDWLPDLPEGCAGETAFLVAPA